MLFNSHIFLAFLPLYLIASYATAGRQSWYVVTLAASYMFYGYWDWRFLGLIIFMTAANFWIGQKIAEAEDDRQRKSYIGVSLFASLGLLSVFKYFNFFAGSAVDLLNAFGMAADQPTLSIILPVGISFYTFQALSYTIDIYRRRISPEPSLLRFAVFIAFFPQLVAGPIVRAAQFLPQLNRGPVQSWKSWWTGWLLIIWGYFLKVGVADTLAPMVDARFANPAYFSSIDLGLGVFFYGFQIYGDFCGYSLIAIGIAKIVGFNFPANFLTPYFARSFSDFWRRWHISLSSWLRDYLYISLGGNRHGQVRTYLSLMITMLLGGLWHGAAWSFVIWGGLHGGYLILQRVTAPVSARVTAAAPGWVTNAIGIVIVYLAVHYAWIFFRAQSLDEALQIINQISELSDLSLASVRSKPSAAIGMLVIVVVLCVDVSINRARLVWLRNRPVAAIFTIAVIALLIAFTGSFAGSSFIYFQF